MLSATIKIMLGRRGAGGGILISFVTACEEFVSVELAASFDATRSWEMIRPSNAVPGVALDIPGRTEAEMFSAKTPVETGKATSRFGLSKNNRVKKGKMTAHASHTFRDEFRFMCG